MHGGDEAGNSAAAAAAWGKIPRQATRARWRCRLPVKRCYASWRPACFFRWRQPSAASSKAKGELRSSECSRVSRQAVVLRGPRLVAKKREAVLRSDRDVRERRLRPLKPCLVCGLLRLDRVHRLHSCKIGPGAEKPTGAPQQPAPALSQQVGIAIDVQHLLLHSGGRRWVSGGGFGGRARPWPGRGRGNRRSAAPPRSECCSRRARC